MARPLSAPDQLRSMDTKTANKAEACLKELRAKAFRAFRIQIIKIYSPKHPLDPFASEHPLDPITETMVSKAAREAERNARQLLDEAVPQVAAISKTPQAFALIDDAIAVHLLNLEEQIEQGRGVPLYPFVRIVADAKFSKVWEGAIRALENHRTDFSGSKDAGGRPERDGWKEAKAVAKSKFPDGFPEDRGTKTKIANIMADWFSENSPDGEDVPGKTSLFHHAQQLIKESN